MPENQELLNEQQQTNAGNAIYILGRNTYDSWEDYGNNIFFVRENSDTLSDMVSLYVGQSKQSDVVVATSESDIWDPITNTYNIPEKYQVSGKLFFIERDIPTYDPNNQDVKMYGTVIWDGEKFVDCGNPNNVIVLTNVDDDISNLRQWLSQNITGIKDFIYIIPNYHSIYYYDGANGYISIISVDNFVTVEMLNEVAARIPIADELTILSRANNGQTEFYGAGADLKDKYVITGPSGSEDSEQAQVGATIFNNYSRTEVSGKTGYKYGTTAIGEYSSAFGTGNVARGNNSVAFGTGNTVAGGCSAVFGTSNTLTGGYSIATGAGNNVGSSGSYGIAVGTSNTLNSSHSIAVGGVNQISSATGSASFGFNNIISSGYVDMSIGDHNTITGGSGTTVIGIYNTTTIASSAPYDNTGTNTYSTVAIGTRNTVSGHSITGSDGFSNIAIGHGNTITEKSRGSIVIGGYVHRGSTPVASSWGNTVNTPESIVIGAYNDLRATDSMQSSESRDNIIIGKQNTVGVSGYYARYVHVFGSHNNIGTSGNPRHIYVIGESNTTSGPDPGTNGPNTYVFGHDNRATAGETMLIGKGLESSSDIVIGRYNEATYGYSVLIASGSGQGSASDPFIKFDAIGMSGPDIIIDPSRKTSRSLYSSYGTSLTMGTQVLSSQTGTLTGTALEFDRLPGNNYIASVTWGTAESIEFSVNASNKFVYPLPREVVLPHETLNLLTLDQTHDYSCLLVIPKLASFTTASNILVNFTANDASRIYLLNPDIDITDYTVLHVLLFYDLTNLCAIVSGYQEVTNP